jgi:hypothetical protein
VRWFVVVPGSVGALASAALVAFAVYTVAAAPDYTASGPQVRFTTATGCPHRLDRFGDVRADGPDLGDALAPSEPARAGVVCSYRSLQRSAAALSASVRLGPAEARVLGGALARVDLKDAPDETSCPADTGRFAVIVLAYSGRPDVDVRYQDSGCRTLDNGVVSAWEVANPSFYNRFAPTFDRLLHNG